MTSLQSAPPRHLHRTPSLRIAVLGTDGVAVDGLEPAVEEIGRRLVRHGHDVTVYGRRTGAPAAREHLGMRCVTPPLRSVGSLSATAFAAAHLSAGRRFDVAFVLGTAHAPLIPLIRSRGTAVAVHVGGVERARSGRLGRRYSRAAEQVAVREADALIADAQAVQDHYEDEFGVPSERIAWGARIVEHAPTDLLEGLGLVPGAFHLAVGRFEPDHHLDVVVEGYRRSAARLPLVVVGTADRPTRYASDLRGLAEGDPRIRLLGPVDDQRLLDQLHSHAASFLHGRSVGGASPSLLRAMGAGTAVVAWDAVPNREVAGVGASYFTSPQSLARSVEEVERYPFRFRDLGELMQERARKRFDWDVVGEQYEALAAKLARGYSTRGMRSGRRLEPGWSTSRVAVEVHRG